MIDRMLPMIAGDSAPIYLAARYWLIKETLPTNKAKNRFLGSDFSLGSVRKSNTNGIRNMRTDNCNTTLVLRFRTSRFVSFASTSTGVPIAPKAVATLFAIKLTVAENIGLNPRLIRIAVLNDGRVRVTGLYSEKTGKTYDATVVLEDDGQYANFKLEFDQRKGGSR